MIGFRGVFLPPEFVKAMGGGEEKWIHMATVREEDKVVGYYLDGIKQAELDWGERIEAKQEELK